MSLHIECESVMKENIKMEKYDSIAHRHSPMVDDNIMFDKSDTIESTNESIKHTIDNYENYKPIVDKVEKEVLSHLGEYIEEPFMLIESYFRNQHLDRLVRHQIESYNHFINYQILRTIQMFNPVIIHSQNDYCAENDKYLLEIFISFENFKLYPPQIHENNGATKLMLPQETKLRNFTYASTMTIDLNIQYVIRNTEKMDTPKIINKVIPKVNIGKMPIMLKSSICVLIQNRHISPELTGECPMDAGGYFIIKGSEKTVLGQERAAENRIYCFDGKNTTKWNWFAEIKSVPDFKCISPKQIEMMIASKNNGFGNPIYVNIPRIKQPIELFVLFRALDVTSDKQICEYILLDLNSDKYANVLKFLQASIIDANKYMTKEDALRHITASVAYTPMNMDKETGSKKKREFALDVLSNDLFPHCKSQTQKLYLLGYMASKLIQTNFGWVPPDDRDSYLNKRIDLTGTLLNNLFRNYFNKLVKEMQKQVVREINNGSWRSKEDYENIINMTNIYKIMKSTTIENGITRALSTGDFSIKQANSTKVGVAQVLNRLTYMASMSHLRRINTPLEKSGELIAPRKLHNTTWGFLCLTGDTDILLSDRINTKKMEDIRNDDMVNTVNPNSLLDQPSEIRGCFCKMPEKLYQLTTVSGRVIKSTGDHPFLVQSNGVYIWKNMNKLSCGDNVIIRHMVKHIKDENTTIVVIDRNLASTMHRDSLTKLGLLGIPIPVYKLKIIARLFGLLITSGTIDQNYDNIKYYVENESDTLQIMNDLKELGFVSKISVCICNTGLSKYWSITVNGSFPHLMYLLKRNKNQNNTKYLYKWWDWTQMHSTNSSDDPFDSVFSTLNIDTKDSTSFVFPEWILKSELSIKREFLSGLQHSKHENDFHLKNNIYKCVAIQTNNDYLEEMILYVENIVNIFGEFDIKSSVHVNNINCKTSSVHIKFENSLDNLNTYADNISYVYCEEKRKKASEAIEYTKTRRFSKIQNSKPENIFYYDIDYNINVCENGCLSVPIEDIKEVEPEMVYDFTTISNNHSFVASSFVTHNCPVETPEGQSIGVVKNISYMAHITIPTNSSSLYEHVDSYMNKIEDTPAIDLYNKVKIFVNGAWVGVTDEPMLLYEEMKRKKYAGIINIYTSIVFDFKNQEIRLCSDGGRLTRPVLKVRNGKALITKDIIERIEKKELDWNDLLTSCKLDESVIEYIDPEEQNYAMIAMKTKKTYLQDTIMKINYTHCEIHPSTIFGVLASCAPFPEHNQSPRNTYQTAMVKQAIGIYAMNFDQRMDKTSYVLNYPSRPLVDTRLMNFIHLNRIPSGCQVHVAIASMTGYNQEDSILINEASIGRGLFSATIYHTEKDEDKNIIRDEIIRCKPDPTKTRSIKYGNYDKLNSQGFIEENTLVENRDIIIAKIIPIKENRNDPTKTIKYEDQSKNFRTSEETYIDKNYTGRNGDGYNFAKVRVRTYRKPVLGDKFASRSAQKGTIGNIIPEKDMPFTKDGLRPDIILNPHAIPSRMTIGQLKETLLGKVLLELGLFGDGTSFGDLNVKTITQELQKLGYESYGNEVMYNGMTGEQMEMSIYFGPVFYQRLKHMVNDKQHSRSIGPMVNLTHQPAEGRSRDGGFRIGEMERDVLCSHGMTKFTKERLFDVSDKYSVHVCKKCGMMAAYNDGNKNRMYTNNDFSIHMCRTCGNRTDFALVEMPYANKLLFQELQTINVVPRVITE